MSTRSIRKVLIPEYGDVDVLQIVNDQLVAPAKGEAQVDIIYAGFSGADGNMRRGWYPMQQPAPLVPGYNFVGRVRANGPGASQYSPGTLVVACTVYDSDATAINIPEKYLVPVPQGVDLKQAAALTLDWNTAYGMVFRTAKVAKGQRVFVHGLSGAVGHALVALCQLQGATVYGTASERNHPALREQGIHPFDYRSKDWIAEMKKVGGAHAVFDPLGYESFDESFSILSETDKCILVGYGQNLASLNGQPARSHLPFVAKLIGRGLMPFCNKSTSFYYITRDQKTFRPELEALFQLAQDGKIQVPIKAIWDLDDIKDAHRSWGKAEGMGSMLIRIGTE